MKKDFTPMDDLAIKSFRDDNDTVFTRGPWKVGGRLYDFKLVDADGEDYCTMGQMFEWNVEMTTNLT